jgi:cell filamentation protein
MHSSRYEFQVDTNYCYPNSAVLINELGLTDQEELNIAEREITSLEIAEAEVDFIMGNFDIEHLKNIHNKIFSSIYSWSGEFRTVDISKGTLFCKSIYIENELKRIFAELAKEKYLIFADRGDVPVKLSHYLGELNAIHPFREGNGRVQRLFIEYLGYIAGYEVNFKNISESHMLKASVETFHSNYDTMIDIFNTAITPIRKELQIEVANEICINPKILSYIKSL